MAWRSSQRGLAVTTTQLDLFNGALTLIGERSLSSTSEATESQRLLTAVYGRGAVNFCLSRAEWRFAQRTVQLDSVVGLTPTFGFLYGFNVPSDHIRTVSLCIDENSTIPNNDYDKQGAVFYSNVDPMYLKYVSNGANYGALLSSWPVQFARYFEHYLASQICYKLTGGKISTDAATVIAEKMLDIARTADAAEGPGKFIPMGRFGRSRHGRVSGGR